MEQARPEPKYKIGQVVVLNKQKGFAAFRVLDVKWSDGWWFYQWNKKNYASEGMIRELNDAEKGL